MTLVGGWIIRKANQDTERNHLNKILAEISDRSLPEEWIDAVDDTAAAALGVPLLGLYRNGSDVKIRSV